MSYWLHPDAEAEVSDAAYYYRQHANQNIAAAFVREFERIIGLLLANQRMGKPIEQGLYTYHFRRFPYSLVYRITPTGPAVYAVAHQRRDPDYWRSRL